MDVSFLTAFQTLPMRDRSALQSALFDLLASMSREGPLTVKGARDQFSAVNRRAREGHMQIVRGSPGEETVLVSVEDLATIIQTAAASISLGDALANAGFRPVRTELIHPEGFERDSSLLLDDVEALEGVS